VVKLGLLAPFEGARREQGYHLLPAIRGATPVEVIGQRIEWVILDTQGNPELARQRTRELLVDPDVLGIIGPLLPAEVEAVAPLIEQGDIAWWPLAPAGEGGLDQWLAPRAEEDAGAAWGATMWPAIRREQVEGYWDPLLPGLSPTFRSAVGDSPWPQDWLAWKAARLAFAAMEEAASLERAAILEVAVPLNFPAPARFVSTDGSYPGILQE
jgi:hypothetical protein